MITLSRALLTLALPAIGATLTLSPVHAQASPDIATVLNETYAKFRNLQEGKNADYIPALAKVDSKIFGIALVTTDGKVYTAGDVKSEVSIQSISKVFTLAKVIEEQGPEHIEKTIGVDATGMRFNSIVSVEFSQKALGGPEMNSLVNPGAIATTSMVKGGTRDAVWKSILDWHSAFAARPLTVNQEVFKSEAATNQRNQAIGALMYAYGYIKEKPDQATDVYTEQCSINVNAKDLATMAATLANGGKNPVSGKTGDELEERALRPGGHGDGRPLRRHGQVALPHRAAGEERRGRRDHRGGSGQVRDRGDLSTARRRRQQRAGPESHRRDRGAAQRQPLRGQAQLANFACGRVVRPTARRHL